MASVKIALRKKPNNQGQYPLCLRITKNRKSIYFYLNEYIKLEEWDKPGKRVKKNHPNSKRLNFYLEKKVAEAKEIVLTLEAEEKPYSLSMVKDLLNGTLKNLTFFEFADEYFETMISSGNYNRYAAEKGAINHFKRFVDNPNLEFSDITLSKLERFKAYLKGTKKVKERTAINYLIVIRALFKRAIKNGLIDKTHYPFGRNGIKLKVPPSEKIGLSIKEIKSIEKKTYPDSDFKHHAKNMFLFSFYFAGMRASDMLQIKWSDIKDGRLYYTMAKNLNPGSLIIPDKAMSIIKEYKKMRSPKSDYLFPEMHNFFEEKDKEKLQRQIKYRIKKINFYLKKIAEDLDIDKKLTMHIARHSFATISGAKIPIQQLKELYRHSSVLTTIGYQKAFLNEGTDDALTKVLDY